VAVLFLLANLIVAATAVRLATVLPLRGALDRVLAAAVLATTQIVASLLIAGTVLQSLRPGTVLLLNAAIVIAVFWVSSRRGSPVRLASVRAVATDLWSDLRSHPWVAALVAVAVIALLWRVVIAYALPPYGYDSLAYHLPTVAGWLQYGHIGTAHLHIYSASFPANVELLFTWLALFLKSDVWIGTVQIPLAVMGALAVVGFARVAGVRRPAAIAAGALFALSPIVLTQASSNYVDLGVGVLFLTGIYFVLRAFPPAAWGSDADRGWSPTCLVLAGCAAGLAVGAKPVGPILGFVTLLCLVIGAVVSRRRSGLTVDRPIVYALLLLVPLVGLGAFWYVRDLVEFSNPVYPGSVKLLGHTLFDGPGITLLRLPTGSGPSAIVHSWGYDLTRLFNHSSGRWDRADEFEGGMGLAWLVLGLPLLIPFVIGAWKRNRMLFWTFLFPFGLLFAIQPYRWWTRFTIFLLAPAFVAIVAFVDRTGSRGLRIAVQSLTLACVAFSLWFSSSHFVGWGHTYDAHQVISIAQKPTSQRTLGRLFLPELRWVDSVGPRARIAVYQFFSTHTDEFPPFYALWGRHFKHRVYALPKLSRTATLQWLPAHSIGYVYVRRGTPQDTWLRSDPRYRVLFSDAKVAAYATAKAAPAAS
jgi:hypothetical protein